MSVRTQAIAKANDEIEQSQQRALAARARKAAPKNALEAMARRLNVSERGLNDTLRSTVFSACKTNEEFIALVIVANEYGLNPLTKEIYAFPAKGGGIVPMVSVDGWIRIMNEHPQFDGIEFEHIVDERGDLDAIEAIIYRKDRSHPIKVIEYLEENKRNTDPWRLMPRRMTRNRALVQCARVAFGFSGIAVEDDVEFENVRPMNEADYEAGPVRLPAASREREPQDDVTHDPQTGMSVVDEDVARELDSASNDPPEQEQVEQEPEDSGDTIDEMAVYADLEKRFKRAETLIDVNLASNDWLKVEDQYDDEHRAKMQDVRHTAYPRVGGNGQS